METFYIKFKRKPLYIMLAVLLLFTSLAHTQHIKVMGYLGGWNRWKPNYSLDAIDWDALTHVMDAFGVPLSDRNIDMFTTPAWGKSLISVAHANNVKCILSIGGAAGSANFPTCISAANVDQFVDNIYLAVVTNGYDGVDIDYEFPDPAMPFGLPIGSDLFNVFMQKLYAKFKDPNSAKAIDGKPLEVTFFFPALYHVRNIDWANIGNYCDYGIHSGYEFATPYNSPLRSSANMNNSAGINVETSLHGMYEFCETQGFQRDQIIMGLPFFTKNNKNSTNTEYAWLRNQEILGNTTYLGFDTAPGPYPGPAEARIQYDIGPASIHYVNDTNAFKFKIDYVTNNAHPGIAIWEIDDIFPYPELWDVIKRYVTKPVTVASAVNPKYVTNDIARTVIFTATVTTTEGAITNVSIRLTNVGGTGQYVRMTNTGPNTWRYAFTIPAGVSQDDHEVPIAAMDNADNTGWSIVSVIIIAPEYIPSLILYDGETIDVSHGWSWPVLNLPVVTDEPVPPGFGTECMKLVASGDNFGFCQLRDPSWIGIDASSAERLEFWIKGAKKETDYIRLRLVSMATVGKYSAPLDVGITTNFRKVSVDVSYLVNIANGADPDFSMSTILGIEMMEAPNWPITGIQVIYFDNIMLTAKVVVDMALSPQSPLDGTQTTDVTFVCRARAALANISTVTLDLTPLGLGKVMMTNISANTSFRFTATIASNTVADG